MPWRKVSMTEETFFECLKRTPRDWQLLAFNPSQKNGLIRRGMPWECPISALCGKKARDYWNASIELNLEPSFACRIADASDATTGYDRDLRSRLLAAVGLPENP